MQKGYENKCIRCGKDRVIVNSRKELGTNQQTITYIAMVCPDAECQAKVDAENAAKQLKKDQIAAQKLAR